MSISPLIEQLVHALQCMPGVGPKSAQRIAFHLLQRDRDGARRMAQLLLDASDRVGHCERCNNFSEEPLCRICASTKRDNALLCVVESPLDVSAIEQSANYPGYYFVLMGHLSPLDGIGPEDIGVPKLQAKIKAGDVKEIILATGTTPEGETTAHYIHQMLSDTDIRISRIAYGVPLGGELEYVDSNTLSLAIASRRKL